MKEKILGNFENIACFFRQDVLIYAGSQVNCVSGCGEVWYRAWMGFKRPRVRISTLGPKKQKEHLLFLLFSFDREIRTIQCNSPVDCCLPPARWRQLNNFLSLCERNCKRISTLGPIWQSDESQHSDQKTEQRLLFWFFIWNDSDAPACRVLSSVTFPCETVSAS